MTNILLMSSLKNTLKFNEVDVKDYVPAYNGESAGLDLYNSGERIYINGGSADYVINKPNFNVLIPTGLKVSIPKGYVGIIQERGSIIKTPLKVRAGIIDSGYTGEIFVNCVNIEKHDFTIEKMSKLPFQLVVVKCDNEFNVVSEKEYDDLTSSSKRKEGMVGSSD